GSGRATRSPRAPSSRSPVPPPSARRAAARPRPSPAPRERISRAGALPARRPCRRGGSVGTGRLAPFAVRVAGYTRFWTDPGPLPAWARGPQQRRGPDASRSRFRGGRSCGHLPAREPHLGAHSEQDARHGVVGLHGAVVAVLLAGLRGRVGLDV